MNFNKALLSLLMAAPLLFTTGCIDPITSCVDDEGYNIVADSYDCSDDFSELMYCNAMGEWEVTDCADGTSCMVSTDEDGISSGECVEN